MQDSLLGEVASFVFFLSSEPTELDLPVVFQVLAALKFLLCLPSSKTIRMFLNLILNCRLFIF